jgi:3-phenylpropionate/cinnamic acid dioxygenase small subunit
VDKPRPRDEGLLGRLRTFYDYGAAMLDNEEYEAWPELFSDDAKYTVVSRENFDNNLPHATIYCNGKRMIRDRVASLVNAVVYQKRFQRRFIGPVRLSRVDGSAIWCEANFLLIESFTDAAPEMSMVGRYIDQLNDTGTKFEIEQRQCVFDNHWTPRSLVAPL